MCLEQCDMLRFSSIVLVYSMRACLQAMWWVKCPVHASFMAVLGGARVVIALLVFFITWWIALAPHVAVYKSLSLPVHISMAARYTWALVFTIYVIWTSSHWCPHMYALGRHESCFIRRADLKGQASRHSYRPWWRVRCRQNGVQAWWDLSMELGIRIAECAPVQSLYTCRTVVSISD